MSNEPTESSFLDEIVAKTMAEISERDEFDEASLERLETTMRTLDILDFERIVQALRTEGE